MQDITERRRAQATLVENERRLRRQNEILRELSQRKAIDRGDLAQALQEITEAAAEVLEVDRTSVWLFNDNRSALRCEEEFVRGSRKHQRGREFLARYAPNYFSAIAEERTINAEDAATDPRTQDPYVLLIDSNGQMIERNPKKDQNEDELKRTKQQVSLTQTSTPTLAGNPGAPGGH